MLEPTAQPEFEPFATARAADKDAELAREGWIRRFVGGPPRLREVRELYESLGNDVRLETLSPEELAEECGDCRLALELFRVVYTRRRVGPTEGGRRATDGRAEDHANGAGSA